MATKRTLSKYRRNSNNKSIPAQEYEYEMIDRNWTTRPYGYCHRYKGYLTKNMALRHNCEKKQCPMFKDLEAYQKYLEKHNKTTKGE